LLQGKKNEYVMRMTLETVRMLPPACAALAALLLTACGGSPAPAHGSGPSAGDTATVPGSEIDIPQIGEPAPQPTETITPPDRTETPAEAPTAPAAASKGSHCEAMRAVKSARPLFEKPPLPCERANRLVYHRRGGGGACGPSTALTVDAAGAVEIETAAEGDAPSNDGACPSPLSARVELSQDDARRLIASSCAAFNAGYEVERGVGCRAAAVRLYFFEGGTKLGGTAALPCPPHALDRAVAELDALAEQLD
jgi:hypothetical protein